MAFFLTVMMVVVFVPVMMLVFMFMMMLMLMLVAVALVFLGMVAVFMHMMLVVFHNNSFLLLQRYTTPRATRLQSFSVAAKQLIYSDIYYIPRSIFERGIYNN